MLAIIVPKNMGKINFPKKGNFTAFSPGVEEASQTSQKCYLQRKHVDLLQIQNPPDH